MSHDTHETSYKLDKDAVQTTPNPVQCVPPTTQCPEWTEENVQPETDQLHRAPQEILSFLQFPSGINMFFNLNIRLIKITSQ